MGFLRSRITACRRFCVALLVTVAHATIVPLSHSQATEHCVVEASAVFNQALSTHRAVLFEVLAGKRRGRWQPDGTFRAAFLSQNARALRDIRNLLSREDRDETGLLQAFRRLLKTKLPRGVYLPKAVRDDETAKFHDSVRAYLSCLSLLN
jgi:hypothetical protein